MGLTGVAWGKPSVCHGHLRDVGRREPPPSDSVNASQPGVPQAGSTLWDTQHDEQMNNTVRIIFFSGRGGTRLQLSAIPGHSYPKGVPQVAEVKGLGSILLAVTRRPRSRGHSTSSSYIAATRTRQRVLHPKTSLARRSTHLFHASTAW